MAVSKKRKRGARVAFTTQDGQRITFKAFKTKRSRKKRT